MGSPARRTESPGSPATPVDAASVILLRDGGDNGDGGGGPQVYMLRRQRTMAFASGMYVFPGGRVDPRDAGPDVPWTGPGPGYFAAKLSTSEPLARALVCAAVRETFEESGVLFADRPRVQTGGFDTGDAEWEADRRALLDRTLAFSDLLVRRGLVLRSDLLRCWAHWITPDGAPLRYGTRFFVAAVPAGQRTRDVGGEYDEVTWVRPADAVEAWSEGAMPMLPPTLRTLAELASYGSVEEVLAAAEHRRIEPIQPKAVLDGEAVRFVLPGDPEYGA